MNRYLPFLYIVLFFFGCTKETSEIASARTPEITKKSTPKKKNKKIKLAKFDYWNFRQEVSRDSNRQTEFVRFDGELLKFSEAYSGYSPSGRPSGEMPAMRYELSDELRVELSDFFHANGLLINEEHKPEPSTSRESRNVYGQGLTVEYAGKTTTLEVSSAEKRGPKSILQKDKPTKIIPTKAGKRAQKLVALHTFLNSLRIKKGATHKPYTKAEIEEQNFVRRNGHKEGEQPSKIQRFYFSTYNGVMKKNAEKFLHPQFSANLNHGNVVVAHRYPTEHLRADCKMNSVAEAKVLKLLNQTKLYELKNGVYLSPDMPEYGMKITKYEFNATFRSKWRVKTYFHFYDTPAVRKKDKEGWIPKFEAFDKGLRPILASKDCVKIEY